MKTPVILLMEEDNTFRNNFKALAGRQGYDVVTASSTTAMLRYFHLRTVELVILGDSSNGAEERLDAVRQIRSWNSKVPIILIVQHSSEEFAIFALKAGVNDYFKPPFALEDLWESVSRHVSRTVPSNSQTPCQTISANPQKELWMIGESPQLRKIKSYLDKVAATESSVLITGETGTGKEMVAHLIHHNSSRRHKPLVCINCAAIPDGLLESELFGYEKGAFTGAHSLKDGQLKLAEGGTVLFDEIGEMSLSAQAKILRAIETKEMYRLGGKYRVPLDIRIVAATNRDLQQLISEGKFRTDLYFRLNVAQVYLPPLRERRDDILPLLTHYLREQRQQSGLGARGFTEEVLTTLINYDWPGNVRELKNLLEAVAINRPTDMLSLEDLPEEFARRLKAAGTLCVDEHARVLSALLATNWKRSEAAQKLHWSRMTLYRKMVKHHINKNEEEEQKIRQTTQPPNVTHFSLM